MNRQELEALGRSHAREAVDQISTYGSFEESVNAYRDNLVDAANERGLSGVQLRIAVDAFEALVEMCKELQTN